MRQIRFRVWDDKRKEWVHDTAHAVNILGECILVGGFLQRRDDTHVRLLELNDMVVEQFTGLHDKNGVDIYEGDMVSGVATSDHELKGTSFIACVEFDDEDAGFFYANGNNRWLHIKPWYATGVEVIGNIHEPAEGP